MKETFLPVSSLDIPKNYFCPLSGKLLFEPMKAKDGCTYEKEVIMDHVKTTGKSPHTQQKLFLSDLKEDMATRLMIEEHLVRHPEHKAYMYLPDHSKKALIEALKAQDMATIKALLKKDVRFYLQPLEKGRNLFQLACEISPEKTFNELLMFFSEQKMLEALKQAPRSIEWKPARLNEKLIIEVKKGNLEAIQTLLSLGADIHFRTHTGKNLLHIAAENHQPEVISFLLKQGLSCNAEEGTPRPLLHVAVETRNSDLINALREAGVSLEIKNANGLAALHKAVISKDSEMIKFLLEKGADPNIKDEKGNTPLHLALQQKLPQEMIFLLIERGAYYKERNAQGQRPIDMVNQGSLLYAMERTHRGAKKEKLDKLFAHLSFLEGKVRAYEVKEQEIGNAYSNV